MNLHATGNLEIKFTNFNDQGDEQPMTLEEIGGPVSVKFAASLKSPFICSDSMPSLYPNCTDSGDIPNKIECNLSDFYGYLIPLATCTPKDGCVSTCTTDDSLCEA